eukprot:CAMPEP_0179202052 /NCGR_PEP_ID=MMETSP0796-20121207/100596_1 /TAXON_ID=73915 /ORGANISM="Pyrodinium bahamense, Strain pbaha01" /LENGTH=274 /DNA_ID=CAMNT_0020906681 /DNA_START=1 /DNA_END=823 /DNA_ORIENTATION=+
MYPAVLWSAAAAYFDGLDNASMVLPGGATLVHKSSQGAACHSSLATAQGRAAVATWETLRSCLREILGGVAPGTGSIPLSNVKRLFRSRFHTELSETALGHAKLSELLQDSRLRDMCSVRLQGHGYVVVPLGPQTGRADCKLCGTSLRERAKWVKPLCLEDTIMGQPPAEPFIAFPPSSTCLEERPSPGFAHQGRCLPYLLGRTSGPAPAGKAPGNGLCIAWTDVEPDPRAVPPLAPAPPQASQGSPRSRVRSAEAAPPARPVLTPGALGALGF